MAGDPNPQRVQTLVGEGLPTIPQRYIQPLSTRPSPTPRPTPPSTLPVLDLQHFHPDHHHQTLHAIAHACAEWGSFQIINHGVATDLLHAIRNAGLAFFRDTPPETRLRYSCDPRTAASEGYGSRMLSSDDGVLDWRDYFDHHTLPLSRRDPSRWPEFPSSYRETVAEYSEEMRVLAQKLLRLVSLSLGLRGEYMEDVIGDVYQNITVSYYPPCPQPELALGLQAHSDIGAITLLVQDDVGGLEVLKDGEWVPVQPIADGIVVILADQTEVPIRASKVWMDQSSLSCFIWMEIISNGIYKSAVHRAVVNACQARLSVAVFYDPSKERKITPASELITEDSPQLYHGVVYGDYLSSWYGLGPDGRRNIEALRVHN